jgi:hypothetical protein
LNARNIEEHHGLVTWSKRNEIQKSEISEREREREKKKKMRERWQLLFIGKNERRGEESVPFVCESVCWKQSFGKEKIKWDDVCATGNLKALLWWFRNFVESLFFKPRIVITLIN